jgi:hypothetical protein
MTSPPHPNKTLRRLFALKVHDQRQRVTLAADETDNAL